MSVYGHSSGECNGWPVSRQEHLDTTSSQNTKYYNFLTLANDQLDGQKFNTFNTILYMYTFRAISCSSSGGQIVLIQHLVSSLSASDRPVHRTVTYWEKIVINVLKFCASSWLLAKVIPRCTVSEALKKPTTFI